MDRQPHPLAETIQYRRGAAPYRTIPTADRDASGQSRELVDTGLPRGFCQHRSPGAGAVCGFDGGKYAATTSTLADENRGREEGFQ
ncbi:hypothetical protein D3C80_1907620 [compost metagenome]